MQHGKFKPNGVILNVYPDSCGGSLAQTVRFLKAHNFAELFTSIYLLPTVYNSDLDRGFSIIDYELNAELATGQDINSIQAMNMGLILDLVLNHISTQSPQFMDLLKKGDESKFVDFFIDWNKFWEGQGEYSNEGYIVPHPVHLNKLFMRKPEFPIVKVVFPDNTTRYFWNTFNQHTAYSTPSIERIEGITGLPMEQCRDLHELLKGQIADNRNPEEWKFQGFEDYSLELSSFIQRNCRILLGQIDLNAKSEKVWKYYEDVIEKLASYGAQIVRLDAFAYLDKQVGYSNFFNEPATWKHLHRIKEIVDRYNIELLPEIHAEYHRKIHQKIANEGYWIYDFYLPGLIIHAIETGNTQYLQRWIKEILDNNLKTINMLGCHDGIPLLDVKGLLPDDELEDIIELLLKRGGLVKNLFDSEGKKIAYYQINSTFFSALEENEKKFLLARAVQLFTPGTPQIWYYDLFAGVNDYEAATRMGPKEINRKNLTYREMSAKIGRNIVKKQLSLIKLRNSFPAFHADAVITVTNRGEHGLAIKWLYEGAWAELSANFKNHDILVEYCEAAGDVHRPILQV